MPVAPTSACLLAYLCLPVQNLPAYKQVWDLVISTGASLQEFWVVKKLYPVLAPVADPVYGNIINSKYVKQLQSHLAPVKKV